MKLVIRKLNFSRADRAATGSINAEVGRGGLLKITFATVLNGHYTLTYENSDRSRYCKLVPMTSVLSADVEVSNHRSEKIALTMPSEMAADRKNREEKREVTEFVAEALDEGSGEP